MMQRMVLLPVLAFAAAAFAAPGGEPTHEFFTTSDGVKIHYMQLGKSGSYVVLVHGYTGNAEGNWFRNSTGYIPRFSSTPGELGRTLRMSPQAVLR